MSVDRESKFRCEISQSRSAPKYARPPKYPSAFCTFISNNFQILIAVPFIALNICTQCIALLYEIAHL